MNYSCIMLPFQTKTGAAITSLPGCVLFILGPLCRNHEKAFSFFPTEDCLHRMETVCFQSKSSQINYPQRNENSWGSLQTARKAGRQPDASLPGSLAGAPAASRHPRWRVCRLSPETGF